MVARPETARLTQSGRFHGLSPRGARSFFRYIKGANVPNLFLKFRRIERAATSIEYALIASLVALAIIVGATALGTSLNTAYSSISSKVSAAAS
jgi:pilus assembly protein Flp/PilA